MQYDKVAVTVKVNKFRKGILMFSNLPKKQRFFFNIPGLASKNWSNKKYYIKYLVNQFLESRAEMLKNNWWFFGKFEDTQITF